MGRKVFDIFMIAVCVTMIVLALTRPLDTMRRTLVIGASIFIGSRRVFSLINRSSGADD
ncbi:MAG: hypothetical protein GF405_00295 [Candidatus Eisenbacteria bacterium]|nr:hypothetical protein [Candidatus Eisenbacteria bacterium]